jgi:hypothetical protein
VPGTGGRAGGIRTSQRIAQRPRGVTVALLPSRSQPRRAIAATAPSCAHQLALGFSPDAIAGFTLEPPGFVQHLWLDSRLVSHATLIDAFDGPYAF